MSNSFAPTGSLRPIVAQSIGRYEKVGNNLKHSTQNDSPTHLPQNWSTYIHPEGRRYFFRESGLSVVTDCCMYNPTIEEQICLYASVAEKEANARGFVLTNDMELFLQLDGEDCNYYFIDRATQTLFWLEDYETSEVGLPTILSASHLKKALEAEYWTHIENFCMHFGGLPQKDIDSLILVFSHAFADYFTSSSSTFPYDAANCEKLLDLLTNSRDITDKGFTTCLVARLWRVVGEGVTHCGQDVQARLSRDASILVDENTELLPDWVRDFDSACHTLSAADEAAFWSLKPRPRSSNLYKPASIMPLDAAAARLPTSTKNIDMFNKASNFTMNKPNIVNAGGDVVTNHYHSYSLPVMQGLQEQVHQLTDKVERMFDAFTGRFWFSPETETETITELVQDPPQSRSLWSNVKVIQTKISMCMPGFPPKILSSVRLSFF